ncbi:GlxA family transcriptional regulator [Edaphobacter bradus]|uniref:GlxA family transcriptional regulator n=1 Tax=Edaphobacter bradus TaxID=2259016 RepID=UPI0021E07EEA|nr:helix-turn-helix domain-containing protein [Edaphobacter bradus]
MAGSQARTVPVFVVMPEPALLLDVAGPLEVLRVANRQLGATRFDVRYVGPAVSVMTSIGIALSGIEPLPKELADGAMVVLSGGVDYVMAREGQPPTTKDSGGVEAIVAWLGRVVRPGHKVVSICSGALLAARAGLLDGCQCTTHHECCGELATLASTARVVENRLYVEDGERYTSAGVTAGIDLMLHIVSQMEGHALAAEIARYLVVYLRRSGADPQLSPWLEGRNHIHPAVHRVQDAIAADPAKSWTLRSLARVAGASSRHLTRLFQEHAGMSITDYKNSLRVALAREMLSQTSLDMERVAERAGFGSTRQLRRAWRRLYETAPREARSGMIS